MLKRLSGTTFEDFFKRNLPNSSFLSSSSGGDIFTTRPEVSRLISLGLNFSIVLGCLSETTTIGLDLTKKESKIIPKSEEQTQKIKPVFEKPITGFIENSDQISNKKFEITTLTSHSKMDPIKQTKYDQMLSQLDSDVITPAKKSSPLNIKPKQEVVAPETTSPTTTVPETTLPATTSPEIIKPYISEQTKTTVQIPPEPEDDDDDIEKIKSNILKTLSKIEQAEVD
mgnify:CR=1 FL=1